MDEKMSWSVRQKSIKELCLFLSLLKSGISVDRIRRAQGKGENFSSPVCWCMVVVCVHGQADKSSKRNGQGMEWF